MGRLYCFIFAVWACEAIIPSYWLRTWVSNALPQVIFWVTLIILLVSVILTYTHDRVFILISHTPKALHKHNVISQHHPWMDWGINGLRLRLVWVWLDAGAVLLLLVFGWTLLPVLGWKWWRLYPTADVAVFVIGVMHVMLGIPIISKRFSLTTIFKGISIMLGSQRSWSGIDIGSIATIINRLFLNSNASPLVTLVIRCTVRETITCLGFGANDKCEG